MKIYITLILLSFQTLQLSAQTNEEKNKFMKMAIELSVQGLTEGSGSYGCVIVKNGEVVGKGFNTTSLSHDPTAHGELNAIRDACKNLGTMSLEGCDLYTNADPCPMCFGAAYWANIKNIYYGITREDLIAIYGGAELYSQMCLPNNERNIKMESVLRNEALKVFEENKK